MTNNQAFFTARRYASAVYVIVLCPSVARRYCTKRLNVGSHKQRRTITQGLYSFPMPKISAKFQVVHSNEFTLTGR